MEQPIEKQRVLTIKGVCETMNCNRQQYYRKYKNLLTPVPTTTAEIFYLESDVLDLKKRLEEEKKNRIYEVVK